MTNFYSVPDPKWAPMFMCLMVKTTLKIDSVRWPFCEQSVLLGQAPHWLEMFFPHSILGRWTIKRVTTTDNVSRFVCLVGNVGELFASPQSRSAWCVVFSVNCEGSLYFFRIFCALSPSRKCLPNIKLVYNSIFVAASNYLIWKWNKLQTTKISTDADAAKWI